MTSPGSAAGGAMIIAPATSGDARALARLHAMAFPGDAWSRSALEEVFAMPGVSGLMATGGDGPRGFILLRRAADEAEILTLAVHAKARRRGIGAHLVEAAAFELQRNGAALLHLEVAADNENAIALYEKANFFRSGLRRGYYRRMGNQIDAVLMARRLQA